MKVKELIPNLRCKVKDTLIRVFDENENKLFEFNYYVINSVLEYYMDKNIHHIDVDVYDEYEDNDISSLIRPCINIYINMERPIMALDFIKNEIIKLFEDENGITFWPSNKNHRVVFEVRDSSRNYASSTYDLKAYVDIEDFTSSCRWDLLEGLLKDLEYVSHTVNNDEEYTLFVEVKNNDHDE